jgi:hypothetical protein
LSWFLPEQHCYIWGGSRLGLEPLSLHQAPQCGHCSMCQTVAQFARLGAGLSTLWPASEPRLLFLPQVTAGNGRVRTEAALPHLKVQLFSGCLALCWGVGDTLSSRATVFPPSLGHLPPDWLQRQLPAGSPPPSLPRRHPSAPCQPHSLQSGSGARADHAHSAGRKFLKHLLCPAVGEEQLFEDSRWGRFRRGCLPKVTQPEVVVQLQGLILDAIKCILHQSWAGTEEGTFFPWTKVNVY